MGRGMRGPAGRGRAAIGGRLDLRGMPQGGSNSLQHYAHGACLDQRQCGILKDHTDLKFRALTVKAGDGFVVPGGIKHDAHNDGRQTLTPIFYTLKMAHAGSGLRGGEGPAFGHAGALIGASD